MPSKCAENTQIPAAKLLIPGLGGARYGGKIGEDTYYRVYATYQLNDDFRNSNGQPADDSCDLWKTGFRFDCYAGNDAQLTWQGDGYFGHLADQSGDIYGFNTLGRWTQKTADRSSFEAQVYVDHTYRSDALAEVLLDTVDVTWQHTFGLGEHNEVIWGLGYRFTNSKLLQSNSPAVAIVNHEIGLNLFSAFVQDQFQIIPHRLTFTLGSKFEHNDFTGFEVQPSARLLFKPTENQTIWVAISRAVRTPSEAEGKDFINFVLGPPVIGPGGVFVPTLFGNTNLKSEELLAFEGGYRVQAGKRVSLDVTAFYNDYRRLVAVSPEGFIPGTPVGVIKTTAKNTLRGESYGGEAVLTVVPTDSWRLSASYSLLMLQAHGNPATAATSLELNAPTHQLTVRSSYDFNRYFSFDAQLRYVDNVQSVPAYVTGDIRLSYRPKPNLEFSVVGQNLFDNSHLEQRSQISAGTVEVPRGFYGKITWRF